MNKLEMWAEKRTWQDYAIVAFMLVLFVSQILVFSQFKHLPSPLYGGDFYRNRAFLQNIDEGYPFYSDAFFLGELNYYPWLWTGVSSLLIAIFGFSINGFIIYSSLFFTLAYALIMYFLGMKIFNDKTYALLLAIISSCYAVFGVSSPKTLTLTIFVPFTIYYFYSLLTCEKHKKRNALLTGIFFGLTGLTYGGSFISIAVNLAVILLLFFLFDFFQKTRKKETSKKGKNAYRLGVFKKYTSSALIIFVAGLILFSIFYLPLLLKYDGVKNNVFEYGDVDVDNFTIGYMLNLHLQKLLNFSNTLYFFAGIFSLLGFVYLLINFKKSNTSRFFIFWIIANIVAGLHHYVSRPLFGTWFDVTKIIDVFFLYFVLMVFGVKFIYDFGKRFVNEEKQKRIFFGVVVALFLVFSAFAFQYFYTNYNSNRWVQYGKTWDPATESLYMQGDWMRQNIGKNDVILSFDESGFVISALSGKKVFLSRRTHASYYIDINQRIADAAVIMYGNDFGKAQELINKYGITYFYLDTQLLSSPFRTTPEYKEYLDKYGVINYEQRERFDLGTATARVYDLVFIPPQNLSESFQMMMEPGQGFQIEGNVIAAIYSINTNPKKNINLG